MESTEIKEGDVVYLKSGGPAMSVRRISGSGQDVKSITCDWCVAGEMKYFGFNPAQLTKEDPNKQIRG